MDAPIPAVTLAVLDKSGNVLATIQLDGLDLSKPMARADLIADIRAAIERARVR